MAYYIKDLKKLDEQISILLQGKLPEEDEKVLFAIQELLEKSYDDKTEVVIAQDIQIEIIKKYGLGEFLKEMGVEKEERGSDNASTKLEPVINFQKSGVSLDEIRLSSIEQAIAGGSEAEIRQAIIEANKLAEQTGPFQEQARNLEFKARQVEAQRYQAIKQEIDTALSKKDPGSAKKAYKRLETLRPDAVGVLKESFETITSLEISLDVEQKIIRAKTLLQENSDYENCKYDELLVGLDLAVQLIQGSHADAELEVLYVKAQNVRARVAEEVNGAETLGAATQYEEQVSKYAELIQKKVLIVDDPKDKSNKIPTSQLHREALQNLRDARQKTVEKRCAKAKELMNTDPGIALTELDDLKPFIEEFKGDDSYTQYTSILGTVKSNKKRWDLAQKIVEGAVNQRDPRVRLVEYEQAHNTFPGHKEANQKIIDTRDEIRLDIRNEANNRLRKVKRELNIKLREIPFDAIEQELTAIDKLIRELGEPEGVLKSLPNEMEAVFEKFNDVKQRYQAIKDVSQQVADGLEADIPNANYLDNLLNSLPEADQGHALLGYARVRVKSLLGDQEIYQEALKAKGRGDYQEYYNLSEKINVDGGLSKKRNELLLDAQLQIDLEELQNLHTRGDYLGAGRRADAILNQIDKKLNPNEYEKVEKIQVDLEKYEQATEIFNRDFSKTRDSFPLDLVKRLAALTSLSENYPNRPELIEVINLTRENIRTAKFNILRGFWQREQVNPPYQPDFDDAYRIHEASSILQENDLIGNSVSDAELVIWADALYQKVEIDYYKELQNWDEVIKKLTDEYGETPPPHIHKQLLDASRAKTLKDVRDIINNAQPNHAQIIPLLDAEIKKNSNLNNDFEFVLLKLVVYLFQDLDVEFLKSQLVIIDKNNPAINEIQMIMNALPDIKRGKKAAQEYYENASYDLLYEQLNSINDTLNTLLTLQNQDLKKFVLFQQVEFKRFEEKVLSNSLDKLRNGLRNKQKSVAEHIQYLFWIDKLSPSATMVKTQLDELKDMIPDAIDKTLDEIKTFCGAEYITMNIEDAHGKALNFITTVNAFLSLPKHMNNSIDPQMSESLGSVKKTLNNCLTEILNLRDKLKAYLQYLEVLKESEEIKGLANQTESESRKKELDEIKISNICFQFEKGQNGTDVFDRIFHEDKVIDRFLRLNQPDVVKFMDWVSTTDRNRKEAIKQVNNVLDGFNYNKGSRLTRDDRIEAWVEKYHVCYDTVIMACKAIYKLGENRQEDVFGLDAMTKVEDSYEPGKIVKGVAEHLKLAVERKKNLYDHSEWNKAVLSLAIDADPVVEEQRIIQAPPVFDILLKNMVISKNIEGLKQQKERLEKVMKDFKRAYANLPKLSEKPNNEISEQLFREGKIYEKTLLDSSEVVEKQIIRLQSINDGFKPLKEETARRLGFRHPPFESIKGNLEKLYNIDPGNEELVNLKSTFQRKISRKGSWWPF